MSLFGERSDELEGFEQVEQKRVGKFTVYRMKTRLPRSWPSTLWTT